MDRRASKKRKAETEILMERHKSTSSFTTNFDLYFNDGQRIIDYVLVYTQTDEQESKSLKNDDFRKKYIENVIKGGLEIEEEIKVRNEASKLVFIKIHVPWNVMTEFAEVLQFRAPIEIQPVKSTATSQRIFNLLRMPNPMILEVPNEPMDFFTTPFRKSKLDKYLGSEDPDRFFSETDRMKVAYELLQSAAYGKRSKAQIGIERLVKEGVFLAAYPLHDGSYKISERDRPDRLNKRQVLYLYWSQWHNWYKYQPLNHIREYFGEKIGLYFAWLGFYTAWLLPAAVVGVLVFFYALLTVSSDEPTRDICNSGGHFKMCPSCSREQGCTYWNLSSMCFLAKAAYIADSPASVFYSVFISFWAVTFLQFWNRKCAELTHRWNCMEYEQETEKPRPEFVVKAPHMAKNPITGLMEPYFPPKIRKQRMIAGTGIVLLMVCVVTIFIIAVIVYRMVISVTLHNSNLETLKPRSPMITSTSGAMLNLIFIMVLGRFYERLALSLTEWEMHRTQQEFDDQYTFKVFIFQFVNFYGSIFYIAFLKGRFQGYPGHYNKIYHYRQEGCANDSCLIELGQQLFVIMVGKQIINNCQEVVIPKLKAWWFRKTNSFKSSGEHLTQVEKDFSLIRFEGLFQEYLEMIIQFGFITLFVAAFPLAPLFALLNNWIEIRLDANKLVTETRRPVAERARNIGIWFPILEVVAHAAVLTNACLIAFTSDFLPRLLYLYENHSLDNFVEFSMAKAQPSEDNDQECRYKDYREGDGSLRTFYWKLMFLRFAFIWIFQNVVSLICRVIDIVIPDIPKSLELKIKREQYLARQQLEEHTLAADTDDGDDDEDAGDNQIITDSSA